MKGLPGFFFRFNILIFIYFFKYETISPFAPTFWTHIISELDGVAQECHAYTKNSLLVLLVEYVCRETLNVLNDTKLITNA